MLKPTNLSATLLGLCLLVGLAFGVSAQDPQPKAKGVNDALPRPDGKPAEVSKTVKVFILMGQSNMLEMGNVAGDKDGTLEYAVKKEGLYPFLIDGEGKWTTRQDVRNIAVMGSGGPGKTQVRKNEWLSTRPISIPCFPARVVVGEWCSSIGGRFHVGGGRFV